MNGSSRKNATIAAITATSIALARAPALGADEAVEDTSTDRRSEGEPTETVVVTGVRASIESALAFKRERLEIVDSIVADDIIKLPDFSVTEALQRAPGVQISRDRGEGSVVTVRGLTQIEPLLNGREVFTAGTGRSLDFADFPSEMFARIDVYKTPSAARIEGGMGATVDLRTRRPFDFEQAELIGSGRLVYGELADDTRGQFSLLGSNRWQLDSAGEFGALLNFSYQERAWREDQKGVGTPLVRNDIVPGRSVTVRDGTSETASSGQRERLAATAILEWRPQQSLELYAEGSYSEFRTLQDSYQINVASSPTFLPGSATLFEGTSDLQSITWTNAPIAILTFARDTVDRTRQVAAGAVFRGQRLTLSTDLSYTESFNNLFFSGPFLAGTAADFSQDLSPRVAGTAVAGTDLLAPVNFRYTGIAYRTRPFDADLTAVEADAEYRLPGFFNVLSAGVRYAQRGANNTPGLIFADAPLMGVSAADHPQFIERNPHTDFFPGENASSIRRFMVGDVSMARDAPALRRAFGIATPVPLTASPLSVWDIEERTEALYAMAQFAARSMPLDGNVGVRAVRTRESVVSASSVPGGGGIVPIELGHTYTDYLPSINLRYRIDDNLYLRAAAAKTLTRPNFNELSPSIELIANPVNPAQNRGAAGNPTLQPIRAKGLDLAIEKYFATGAVYLTGFLKKVDGFVTNVSAPEVHDGATYQVTRPQNASSADVEGFEIGYQQFGDFLPGLWRGLGLQVNYTYVHSETHDRLLGNVPLQNLSRHSYNVIATYEYGKVSTRIAYNWRDRFLSGINTFVGVGSLPVYTEDYGWLDAAVSYRFDDRISVAIEGMNLLNTLRWSHYGSTTRPQSYWVNDRQIGIMATIRF